MKVKIKIKKGDTVKVIAGNHRGKQGKVLAILTDSNKAVVEGVNLVHRHTKPSAANPQGGIIKKEAPIHISNLVYLHNDVATKIGRKIEENKIVRYSKKSGEVIK
jgi:large subunit ribosomal protein L24